MAREEEVVAPYTIVKEEEVADIDNDQTEIVVEEEP